MRKVLLLLLVTLMWGCQERLISPEDAAKTENPVEYGSTAIRLPGLKGLGNASEAADCYFELTISGNNMDDMVFSFQLGEKDTMVVIEKIPAGAARQFNGVLREGKIITHEGVAEARIQPGKVAFVKLYLRASGSAEVEVIIDDGTSSSPLEGCMKIEGVIDGEPLDELSIEILDVTGDQFWTYIKRNGEFAGKFWGTLNDHSFEGEFAPEGTTLPWLVIGDFTDDWSAFKSLVVDINDTTRQVGVMEGYGIDCNDIPDPPQTCFTDTIDPQIGCATETVLAAICLEQCIDMQVRPGSFYFVNPCSKGEYEAIAFTYCLPDTANRYCYSDSIDAPDGCLPEEMMITLYLEYCIDKKVIPGSFSLVEPCNGKEGKGYSRIIFDFCSEYPMDPPSPPSECLTDSIDAPGSCMEPDALVELAIAYCVEKKATIGKVNLVNACTAGFGIGYSRVIFEYCTDEPTPPPPAPECYGVDGVILEDTLFGEMYMRIIEFNESSFTSQLFRSGSSVGGFYGYFDNEYFDFTGFIETDTDTSMVKGTFVDDRSMFKGTVLDINDTTHIIGYIDGYTVDCSEINPPEPPPAPPIKGCFELFGNLRTYTFDGIISYTKDYENNSFQASLARDGVYAGYMFGNADDEIISANMVFETDTAMVKGDFSSDGDAFDVALFSIYDTTEVIGKLHGEKVECPAELFR